MIAHTRGALWIPGVIVFGDSDIIVKIHRNWSVSIHRLGAGRGSSLWVSPVDSG